MSLGFVLLSLVIVATPGTGVLLTVSAGLSRGRRAGVITAVGCTLGIVPHLVAAATWRDRSPIVAGSMPPRSSRRMITNAILANLLNPKLTLFFFTFLPLFIPTRASHPTLRLLLLSSVFMGMTLVVFVAYGLLAAAGRRAVIDRPHFVRRMRQAFALTFVGLGAKLASARR